MRMLAVLGLIATSARAGAAPNEDLVARPIVLAPGQLEAELVVESNLAPSGGFAKPLSLAPDLWIGVTGRLTLGLVHSDPSLDRIQPGASFCVRREDLLCDETYRGGGLDARYLAYAAPAWAIAPRVRLLVRGLDPVEPALAIGSELRWQRGRYAITGDPYLQLGLAHRERGNRARLWLPVALAIQPTCRWVVELHTGWNSDLAVASDGWHVPFELAVRAAATAHVDLGAAFGFTSLLGPQNTPKERVAFLTIGFRS